MVIVDKALAKRQANNDAVKVGMIGAGFMGRGIALQILKYTVGMDLVAIYNRTVTGAQRAYAEAGIEDAAIVNSQGLLEDRINSRLHSVVEDPMLICRAENIDVVIEVTGTIEFGARVVFEAISNRKHVVMMNAELDGTVGAILKTYADKAGLILTNVDGDQPGVQMNLFRFVKSIGLTPVLCGNIKGLQDPYRNPTTQEGFAKKWGQKPAMVASFADGTKISFEQAIVANATGMSVGKRGMYGPVVAPGTHLKSVVNEYPKDVLMAGSGIVDYVVGAEPGPGVFVVGVHDHPVQQHYLNLYKLGEGPLYLFYTPYHLCHFEVPITCARAAIFLDAAVAPLGAPTVEVVATAKIDLARGERLDGIGCYMTYGQCETASATSAGNLLPMGLAEGCVLKRNIRRDQVITYDDVILPYNRFSDFLRGEQNKYFDISIGAVREITIA